MSETVKIGIIICDRYRRCAGGKCFQAVRDRDGAFARYAGVEVEVVGYTSCDGCPWGNVEYAVDEMKNNGAGVVHLATGLIVGYPPCPFIENFRQFIETKYGLEVVYGTPPDSRKNTSKFTQTWGPGIKLLGIKSPSRRWRRRKDQTGVMTDPQG